MPLKEWYYKELEGMSKLHSRVFENLSPDGWMFWKILCSLQFRYFTMDIAHQIAFEDKIDDVREKLKKDSNQKNIDGLITTEDIVHLNFLDWETFKKIKLEEQKPEKIWLLVSVLTTDSRKIIINQLKQGKITYSLYSLFQMRYIAEKLSTNEREQRKNMFLRTVIKELDDRFPDEFECYKKRMKRHLFEMFDCIFGAGVFQTFMKQKKQKQPFNLFDCQFFSFILNTYDCENAIQFRMANYAEVEMDYLRSLIVGVDNLILGHEYFEFVDSDMIFKKWLYHFRNETIELRQAIISLKENLNLLLIHMDNNQWNIDTTDLTGGLINTLNQTLDDLLKKN
jgi:hypothetical protein